MAIGRSSPFHTNPRCRYPTPSSSRSISPGFSVSTSSRNRFSSASFSQNTATWCPSASSASSRIAFFGSVSNLVSDPTGSRTCGTSRPPTNDGIVVVPWSNWLSSTRVNRSAFFSTAFSGYTPLIDSGSRSRYRLASSAISSGAHRATIVSGLR